LKVPRVRTLIIVVQSILLLVGLGFLAIVLFCNWGLKMEAKRYAITAGLEDAQRCFQKGNIWLYQIKQFKVDSDGSGPVPTDGDIEPSGKMEGRVKVYYFLVDQGFEYGHLEIQQAYVSSFNEHMRQFVDHPEQFDTNGYRIPPNELKQRTNNLSTSKIKNCL
jgi:hypothetical protein